MNDKELNFELAEEIQESLKSKIVFSKINNFSSLRYIAGVDLAYWKSNGKEYAVCCIVTIDRQTLEIVDKQFAWGIIDVPYKPGCLAFRELPLVLETVEHLQRKPDVYIFDGNGYLHPRHMGIATHASFYLNTPTIGVAKNYYKIREQDFIMPENKEFAYTDIVIDGEIYGRAIRTHIDVKPIFLSVGNFITLDSSMELIISLVTKESHIPIPTRLADIESHARRKMLSSVAL